MSAAHREGGRATQPAKPVGKKGSRAGLLLTLFPVLFSLGLMAATIPHLWRLSALPINGGPVGGPFHLVTATGQDVTQRSWPGHDLLVCVSATRTARRRAAPRSATFRFRDAPAVIVTVQVAGPGAPAPP